MTSGESTLAAQLDTIRRELLHWCNWNQYQRDLEGLTTENDTHIISVPPHWPTHGVLRRWAATIDEARKLADANSKESP